MPGPILSPILCPLGEITPAATTPPRCKLPILSKMPPQGMISMMAGVIDYYYWKGIPCARKWPSWKLKERSPSVQAQWVKFSYIMHFSRIILPKIKDLFTELAVGTTLTWRDHLVRSYIAGIDYQLSRWTPPAPVPGTPSATLVDFTITYTPFYSLLKMWTDVPCRLIGVVSPCKLQKQVLTKQRRGRTWPWATRFGFIYEMFHYPRPGDWTYHELLYGGPDQPFSGHYTAFVTINGQRSAATLPVITLDNPHQPLYTRFELCPED